MSFSNFLENEIFMENSKLKKLTKQNFGTWKKINFAWNLHFFNKILNSLMIWYLHSGDAVAFVAHEMNIDISEDHKRDIHQTNLKNKNKNHIILILLFILFSITIYGFHDSYECVDYANDQQVANNDSFSMILLLEIK